MLERFYVTPKDGYTRKGFYTPVVVVRTSELVHIYVAGRTARLKNGEVSGKGDMRAQIRLTCENLVAALQSVGATLADVVRTETFTTDMDEYFRHADERFKFFKEPLPTSAMLGVTRLSKPDMLVEIVVEAVMEPDRLKIEQ